MKLLSLPAKCLYLSWVPVDMLNYYTIMVYNYS